MRSTKTIITLLTLVLTFSVSAQIQFSENTPFKSLLEQAKKEDKLIFMDCYTTWCGPCKWLSKTVFSDAELGNVYNAQFINFKSDMEKGEGLEIAQKYNIDGYPTLLWLNGEGEVVYQVVGAMEKENFIRFAQELKNEENTLPNLIRKYNEGIRESSFLEKLAKATQLADIDNADEYALSYLKTIPQSSWLEPKNLSLLFTAASSFESEATHFILDHRSEITAKDSTFVRYTLEACADRELKKVLQTKSEKEFQAFLDKVQKYSPERTEYQNEIQLYFYKATGNRAKLNSLTSSYLKDSKNAGLLNNYAWDRFENETDTALLKEAIVWAERSVKIEKDYANTDTLGNLYQKIGNKKKAEKWLKESKRLEEKAG